MTTGVTSPGEMGHTVGNRLREHGATVLTSLGGRSERSRGLAAKAGMVDAGSLDDLIKRVDVLLAILAPAEADRTSERVAAALRSTGASPLDVDCSASAPANRCGPAVTGLWTRRTAANRFARSRHRRGRHQRSDGTTRLPRLRSRRRPPRRRPLAEHGLDVRSAGTGGTGRLPASSGATRPARKGCTPTGPTEMLVAAPPRSGIEAEMREAATWQCSRLDQCRAEIRAVDAAKGVSLGWRDGGRSLGWTSSAALAMTPKLLEGAAEHYAFIADDGASGRNRPKPETPHATRTEWWRRWPIP